MLEFVLEVKPDMRRRGLMVVPLPLMRSPGGRIGLRDRVLALFSRDESESESFLLPTLTVFSSGIVSGCGDFVLVLRAAERVK